MLTFLLWALGWIIVTVLAVVIYAIINIFMGDIDP